MMLDATALLLFTFIAVGIGSFTSNMEGVNMLGFTTPLHNVCQNASEVDVIFRPDPAAVETRADWSEIWGEEIVMPNVPIIRTASQKELHRQALLSSLHVTGVRLGAQHGRRITSPSLDCFPVQALPVPLRYQVFIRAGEFEHEFGTLMVDNGRLTKTSLRQPVLGFPEEATTADVILRPYRDGIDPETWKRHGYWDEEIVFRNVPVIRPSLANASE